MGNPIPADGLIGRLTPDQEDKLREFWQHLYGLIDEAPERGTGSGAKSSNTVDKGIPKDDQAKERAKAEQELRDAKAAFQKYGRREFMAAVWRLVMGDDPDMLMMKFLRARKFNVAAGVAMFCAMMKWRLEGDVEKIVQLGEEGMKDAEGFIAQMSSGKTYIQGTDREGRPVVYIHVRLHRLMDQSAKALEDFVIFSMECSRLMLTPPIREKATIIFDMTGFGLANMDWRCVLFIVKCLESYYPESLNCLIIHNAPWVFQGIWKILYPMLDPVVRMKVTMTKNTEELEVHIERKHLIKQLGGESEWKWEYEPVRRGENDKQHDERGKANNLEQRERLIRAFDDVTRKWMITGDPMLAKVRKYVAYHIRVHYYVLDPYVRGRSVYHRKGNIVGNGLVAWEYPGLHNGAPEGEWDVMGYENSREQLIVNIKRLRAELKDAGVRIPDLGDIEKATTGGGAINPGSSRRRTSRSTSAGGDRSDRERDRPRRRDYDEDYEEFGRRPNGPSRSRSGSTRRRADYDH